METVPITRFERWISQYIKSYQSREFSIPLECKNAIFCVIKFRFKTLRNEIRIIFNKKT
jgi:hypothetical protein